MKTVIISAKRVVVRRSVRQCSPPTTPSLPSRRRRDAAASASSGSAVRASPRHRARPFSTARTPLEPRRATLTRIRGAFRRPRGRRSRRRPTFPRRTPTPARTSSRSARTAARWCSQRSSRARSPPARGWREPGEFTLRAFLNGKRDLVQAEAVADLIEAATPLQARVAFDQLEGTLTRRIAAIDARAVRSDRAARGVARFSRRGIPLHRAGETRPTRDAASSSGSTAARRRAARPADSRGRDRRRRRPAQRRQVEPVQRAGRRRPRDRDRDRRHDARSRDRARRHRRPRGHAGRHRRVRARRSDVVEREGVARGEQARGVADLVVVVARSQRAADAEDRSSCSTRRVRGRRDRRREQERSSGPAERRLVVGDGVERIRRSVDVSATTGCGPRRSAPRDRRAS